MTARTVLLVCHKVTNLFADALFVWSHLDTNEDIILIGATSIYIYINIEPTVK